MQHSKLGYYFQAIREDQDAAHSLGINLALYKNVALAISAAFTACAGGFYALYVRFIDPNTVFGLDVSVQIVLIAIIGGIGTILGPVIGAVVLVAALRDPAQPASGLVQVGVLPGRLLGRGRSSRPTSPTPTCSSTACWWCWSSSSRPTGSSASSQGHRQGAEAARARRASAPRRRARLNAQELPPGDALAILEIKHVSKFFGGLAANSDVSFSVEGGTIMGLIGPNGAGKTTLFNCITGYYPPSKGEVLFKGARMNGLQPDQVCHLGMVRTWQKVRPLAKLTVLDNVMVGALARTWSLRLAREVAMEQLQVVQLGPQARFLAGGLPIGERKKLEVARVLATKPELLLLDEVMGGLNPAESEEIIQLILELKKARAHPDGHRARHEGHHADLRSDRGPELGREAGRGRAARGRRAPDVITAYLGERIEACRAPRSRSSTSPTATSRCSGASTSR